MRIQVISFLEKNIYFDVDWCYVFLELCLRFFYVVCIRFPVCLTSFRTFGPFFCMFLYCIFDRIVYSISYSIIEQMHKKAKIRVNIILCTNVSIFSTFLRRMYFWWRQERCISTLCSRFFFCIYFMLDIFILNVIFNSYLLKNFIFIYSLFVIQCCINITEYCGIFLEVKLHF